MKGVIILENHLCNMRLIGGNMIGAKLSVLRAFCIDAEHFLLFTLGIYYTAEKYAVLFKRILRNR